LTEGKKNQVRRGKTLDEKKEATEEFAASENDSGNPTATR